MTRISDKINTTELKFSCKKKEEEEETKISTIKVK